MAQRVWLITEPSQVQFTNFSKLLSQGKSLWIRALAKRLKCKWSCFWFCCVSALPGAHGADRSIPQRAKTTGLEGALAFPALLHATYNTRSQTHFVSWWQPPSCARPGWGCSYFLTSNNGRVMGWGLARSSSQIPHILYRMRCSILKSLVQRARFFIYFVPYMWLNSLTHTDAHILLHPKCHCSTNLVARC